MELLPPNQRLFDKTLISHLLSSLSPVIIWDLSISTSTIMSEFALQFVLSASPRPVELHYNQFKSDILITKDLCPKSTLLPLPMQTLTLCGFERSRPSQIQQCTAAFPLAMHTAFASLPIKRTRETESCDIESAPSGRDRMQNFDHAPAQLQGPSSDGESSSKARIAKENRQERMKHLQRENDELLSRIRSSDEELKQLRDIINQLFEVEKSQKRSKDDSKPQRRYWNNDEHERFLQALQR